MKNRDSGVKDLLGRGQGKAPYSLQISLARTKEGRSIGAFIEDWVRGEGVGRIKVSIEGIAREPKIGEKLLTDRSGRKGITTIGTL